MPNAPCPIPMPNAPCPMPNTQKQTVKWIEIATSRLHDSYSH
ncbi:hypothetical protein [Tolypothrix sp. FACHB-123]|nr:hypothetical protein [Tolypothrix sp. FACHB-123]